MKKGTHFIEFTEELRRLKNQRMRYVRRTAQWKKTNALFRKALRKATQDSCSKTQTDFMKDRSGSGVWRLLRRANCGKNPSSRIYDADAVASDFCSFHDVDDNKERIASNVPSYISLHFQGPSIVTGVTSVEIKDVLRSLPK